MPERRSLHSAVPDSNHKHATGWLLASHRPLSFLWPGLRRHQAVYAVIHDQLPVVLAGMLDEFVGQIPQPHMPVPIRVDDGFRHSGIPLRFDRGSAIGERLFHIRHDFRFGFELVLRRIFFGGHLLAHRGISEEIG